MKYIVDTDPGIDDAVAIMLGIKNNLDIIGFTLATGNIDKEQSANNLKTIQNIIGSDIPMYYGKNENKANMISAEYAHGKDGLGNILMPRSSRKFASTYAEDFIIESANKYKNNLTFICLGPLTNLASAIKKDKTIVDKISKVVIMGCSYSERLNIPYKEFNVKIDPESANLVLTSNFRRINIITHEIGVNTFIEKDYMDSLKNSSDKLSKFTYLISQKYMEFSYDHYRITGCCMPDPTAIASVIDESILTFVPCSTKLKNDLIFISKEKKSNIYVASDINLDKFNKLFKNTFKK